jgi:hypothetical protein
VAPQVFVEYHEGEPHKILQKNFQPFVNLSDLDVLLAFEDEDAFPSPVKTFL